MSNSILILTRVYQKCFEVDGHWTARECYAIFLNILDETNQERENALDETNQGED